MRLTALVKIDSKGRVTIPQTIREALGIEPGMMMAIIADIDRREILVSPIFVKGASIYQIDLQLHDRPGALAKVANLLASHKVDIIASKCASITRGREAGCTIIADFSNVETDVGEIRRQLEELDVVIQVKITRFETGMVHI